MRNDNWGSKARIGIFVVGSEVVPEAEWWAMAPDGVSIHAARVSARAPWATWNDDRSGVDLAPDLERGAAQFAGMRLAAVTVAHTSSSVQGGTGWDEAVIARLEQVIAQPTGVTTNGLDYLMALRQVGVKRPFVVLPPWFDEAFVTRAMGYLTARGCDPAGGLRHVPDAKWSGLRPDELYKHFMHIEQDVDLLFEQIVSNVPEAADGVLIGGTGFRCVGIIERLEQASLWRCLQLAGVPPSIRGYGRLLA